MSRVVIVSGEFRLVITEIEENTGCQIWVTVDRTGYVKDMGLISDLFDGEVKLSPARTIK